QDEQIRRVVPVIEQLAQRVDVPISVDTSGARVAREALAAGAQIVNDVTALRGDPQMLEVLAEFHAAVCVMHMQGTPQTMQDAPHYDNVVQEIRDFLRARVEFLEREGIDRARIAVDPG